MSNSNYKENPIVCDLLIKILDDKKVVELLVTNNKHSPLQI